MSTASPARPRPATPRWLHIAKIAASSQRSRWRFRRGQIEHFAGSSTQRVSVADSAAYVRRVFDDYLHFGRLTAEDYAGASLLELGPGDNVGALLLFLADGAARAVAVDKFYSQRDREHEKLIYLALRAGLAGEALRRFDRIADLSGPEAVIDPGALQIVYGVEGQFLDRVVPPGSADLILSRAVLQEVRDIGPTLDALDRALKPGGRMLHKIDLRDHGMFSSLGFHPREFLTIPESLYRWMADDGKHNRKMLDYYRRRMRELGYTAEFYLTAVLEETYPGQRPESRQWRTSLAPGVDYGPAEQRLAEEIRPRLAAEFRQMTDEEILAASAFLDARKPIS